MGRDAGLGQEQGIPDHARRSRSILGYHRTLLCCLFTEVSGETNAAKPRRAEPSRGERRASREDKRARQVHSHRLASPPPRDRVPQPPRPVAECNNISTHSSCLLWHEQYGHHKYTRSHLREMGLACLAQGRGGGVTSHTEQTVRGSQLPSYQGAANSAVGLVKG